MRVVQTQHILLEGVQERRAAVYREASGPDCGCIVRFRPPGLAWHPTLDRIRPGHEPVSLEQSDSAEGLRLTRSRAEAQGALRERGGIEICQAERTVAACSKPIKA